jgi:hypothetical protein
MLPVETLPVEVMLLIVVLLITPVVPGGAVLFSGTVNEPDSVPMVTLLAVPWPAVMAEPKLAVPTDMPEMLPVETLPVEVTVPMVVLLITPVGVPTGALLSFGAVNEPDSEPMLTLLVVP